jgi:Asp-tRNA(Asn)/Glu-tRNA(Gln) amidotransferase A subunit family amidase
MSFTNDQLGVNARSIQDIILYDKALTAFSTEEAETAAMHEAVAEAVDSRAPSSIKIGTPLYPFVEWTIPAGLNGGSNEDVGWAVNSDVREKLEQAAAALESAGFMLAREEWPDQHFDYLGREVNVLLEACWSGELVNGKMMDVDGIATFGGQISQFVKDYFGAPVSLKDIAEDMSRVGKSHDPGSTGGIRDKLTADETQYRYFMSHLEKKVAAYNSYFDHHSVDLIMIPDAMCATPDLCTLAGGTCPRTKLPSGEIELSGSSSEIYRLHSSTLKEIHIPKMVIPTGLTEDGRPSSVQVWGRAVDYGFMFDDIASVRNDVAFLYLVEKVAAAIQADPRLRRQDAALAADVVAASAAPKL